MCMDQISEVTRGGWMQDPLIRLMMASDHVSEHEMRALLDRVSVAVAARREALRLIERQEALAVQPIAATWRNAPRHAGRVVGG